VDWHRAVGATLVSAVLFSSLIVSNAALLASSEDRSSAASLSDGESTLYSNAIVLQGVGGLELLAKAQAVLSSRAFDCPNATGEAHGAVGGLSFLAAGGGVSSTAVALPDDDGPEPDNLSILRQFDGGFKGHFNMLVRTVQNGSYPGGRVTYSKTEYHVLNLPFDPTAAASFCLAALEEVTSGLGPLLAGACNASEIAAAVDGIRTMVEAAAASEGLRSYVTYVMGGGAPCSVTVAVRVAQQGIMGPDGPFTWSVAEEERLPSLGRPP
jgi:hypothetical protein